MIAILTVGSQDEDMVVSTYVEIAIFLLIYKKKTKTHTQKNFLRGVLKCLGKLLKKFEVKPVTVD